MHVPHRLLTAFLASGCLGRRSPGRRQRRKGQVPALPASPGNRHIISTCADVKIVLVSKVTSL